MRWAATLPTCVQLLTAYNCRCPFATGITARPTFCAAADSRPLQVSTCNKCCHQAHLLGSCCQPTVADVQALQLLPVHSCVALCQLLTQFHQIRGAPLSPAGAQQRAGDGGGLPERLYLSEIQTASCTTTAGTACTAWTPCVVNKQAMCRWCVSCLRPFCGTFLADYRHQPPVQHCQHLANGLQAYLPPHRCAGAASPFLSFCNGHTGLWGQSISPSVSCTPQMDPPLPMRTVQALHFLLGYLFYNKKLPGQPTPTSPPPWRPRFTSFEPKLHS